MTLSERIPTEPEKVKQIQENLITYFRLFDGLPGVTFVEEDITWATATRGIPGNQVFRTQVSDEAVDARINDLIRRIGQSVNQVDWFVFPDCQPADLGERIVAAATAGGPDGEWTLVGQIGGPGGRWMLADLAALPDAPEAPDGFRVEHLRDTDGLARWLHVSRIGFGHEVDPSESVEAQPFYAAYARHGFGRDAFSLHYIGFVDDEPVTASTLLLAGGIAGLYDVSTPPSLRRQGYGSAISRVLMVEAQKRGYKDAFVWSSPMGKGVYGRIGYALADIGMREYCWQKR